LAGAAPVGDAGRDKRTTPGNKPPAGRLSPAPGPGPGPPSDKTDGSTDDVALDRRTLVHGILALPAAPLLARRRRRPSATAAVRDGAGLDAALKAAAPGAPSSWSRATTATWACSSSPRRA
jgi:hypothetical protein